MKPKPNYYPCSISHSSRSPGFALVVTLSLMILLTVIAIDVPDALLANPALSRQAIRGI